MPADAPSSLHEPPESLKAQDLPAEYLRRMQGLLGEEFPGFLEIYAQPPAAGLRVNTLKILVENFLRFSPFHLEALPWSTEGFRLLHSEAPLQPGKHPYHAAGLYYLQDPSAMAAVELLDPKPGEKVLDLAAAPGGKSTHIIARMNNQGLLVANETHPRRLWDLAENLERWGAHNTAILNASPERLADHFGPFFDRLLVDAPCSGEGMFRKSQAARSAWNPGLVQSCALRQLSILEQAARLVRPGGVLAYSTCTFAPEENEAVIARFLEAHSKVSENAFEVIQAHQMDGFAPGKPEWAESALLKELPPSITAQLNHTVRLFPQRGAPEGHFIALLRRTGEASQARPKPYPPKVPPAAREAFERFCAENLAEVLLDTLLPKLTLEGTYLYARPRRLPSLGRLRCVHPGWWLGVLRANRFVPSHALAMGISADQAARSLRLQPDDPSLLAYLRGESLKSAGEEGWLLVTVQPEGEKNAFPLGWGRRSGNIIKNYYPRGLRWI